MVTNSKGMIQFSGTTYRIVERCSFHEVIRVMDDRPVGSFRHAPTLQLIESKIPPDTLLQVARLARASARLSWPPRAPERPSRAGVWLETALAYRDQVVAMLLSALTGTPPLQAVSSARTSTGRCANAQSVRFR